MNRKSGFWVALWAALLVITGFLAFGSGPGTVGYGPWHDWGRMGGWNDDSRGGASGGYGMGPGMMGGIGAGRGVGMPYGMMGQMGPGMPGMGMGFDMVGGGYAFMPGQLPGLSSEQSQQLSQLQQAAQTRNSSLVQQIWATHNKLNLLLMNEKRDWSAIRAASQTLFDLQRQQHDAAIDLQQKIDGVLTDSQRQEMARSWQGLGWMRSR